MVLVLFTVIKQANGEHESSYYDQVWWCQHQNCT